MAAFLHPGVYVLETGSPPRSIEAASTSTAIFVGETERGPTDPVKLTSRSDFTRQFGGYLRQNTSINGNSPTLAYAMDAFFGNGGTTCYVLRVVAPKQGQVATASRTKTGANEPTLKVLASSPGGWANGTTTNGVHVAFLAASDASASRFRVVVGFTDLSVGVQAIVEDFDRLSIDPNDENYVVDTLNRSLYIKWDPATTPAVPTTFDTLLGDGSATAANILLTFASGNLGLSGGAGGETDGAYSSSAPYGDLDLGRLDDLSDASLLIIPRVADDTAQPTLNGAGIAYAMNRPLKDLFYVGSMKRYTAKVLTTNAVQTGVVPEFQATNLPKNDFAAVYWPWIRVNDPIGTGKNPTIVVAPAPTVAGVYARTDANRGVWKAPAGVEATLLGAQALEFNVQDIQQDILNPLGVNALRTQPGAGAVIWGARTMVPASQWRYVPVRRTAIFLRKSIYNGIQFAVFEGNDEPLWSALRLTIGGFMDSLYRQGAFAGGSPSEAYFVKCDAETTTAVDQVAGVVNILVGFSPLRPAEFVVVKLSQIVSQKG
jgi:phage tail sheath protein FI